MNLTVNIFSTADTQFPTGNPLQGIHLSPFPSLDRKSQGWIKGERHWGFQTGASVSPCQLLGYSEKPLTLQMFIGTADERSLRPHAFYQVHRITGKMVATASYEAVVSGTKVLEMTLLPENNMAAK